MAAEEELVQWFVQINEYTYYQVLDSISIRGVEGIKGAWKNFCPPEGGMAEKN